MPDSKSGVLPLDDFLVLKKNCGLCGPQFKKLVDRRLHLYKGQHTRRILHLLALLLEESFVGCAVKHIDALQSEVPQAYQPFKKLSMIFPSENCRHNGVGLLTGSIPSSLNLFSGVSRSAAQAAILLQQNHHHLIDHS